MNRIYFGDNLQILKEMPDESIDLIYIDPPFNTKRIQKRTTIKTIRDDKGDRKGFKGNTYKTIELDTKAYEDSLESTVYINEFLKPRLTEAYRLLKPHGSLYFHIDYREVHYCKVLLDSIFGRQCFLNEIIWAYDYGGRAKSRWPAKHDNILFYVKDPNKYIFNSSAIDREPYMAPGLVGPEKEKVGKLPTDVWWPGLVGAKINGASSRWYLRGQNTTWWQTIVPTNSKERLGYPTQKPRKLLDRIIKASSFKGSTVLDFFAGSGTTGESCLALERNFILIDNNKDALEVMARRFAGYSNIEWINFDPRPYQGTQKLPQSIISTEEFPKISTEFITLASTASAMQEKIEAEINPWENSPFEWIVRLPARKKGKVARQLIASWLESKGIACELAGNSSETLLINGHRFAIKFSTIWEKGFYKFQQLRAGGYEYAICLGISPFNAHCWIIEKNLAIKNAKKQHGTEYWLTISPNNSGWAQQFGGDLEFAYKILRKIVKK
ncbi:MAG: site-specific DNA-methyltransferase [Chloroflexota bacterium]